MEGRGRAYISALFYSDWNSFCIDIAWLVEIEKVGLQIDSYNLYSNSPDLSVYYFILRFGLGKWTYNGMGSWSFISPL